MHKVQILSIIPTIERSAMTVALCHANHLLMFFFNLRDLSRFQVKFSRSAFAETVAVHQLHGETLTMLLDSASPISHNRMIFRRLNDVCNCFYFHYTADKYASFLFLAYLSKITPKVCYTLFYSHVEHSRHV